MHAWRCSVAALSALAGAACGDGGAPVADAAPAIDAPVLSDAAVVPDATASLGWVDFALSGCARTGEPGEADAGPGDAGPPVIRPCTGAAPLALRFTAVAPAPIDTYVWAFGDGTGSSEPYPAHVYDEPGVYDVSLTVAGAGGTASVMRPALVEVAPAPLGSPCTADAQCAPGLECVCGAGDDCSAAVPGVCAAACSAEAPCAAGACVDLGAARSGEAWHQRLCLVTCSGDDDCPGDLTCQELLSATGGWVRACFAPNVVRAMGESCLDAAGAPDHAVCASGLCAALGARGVCTQACTAGSCPGSSACANLPGDGPDLCVRRCEPGVCTSDPWLACEPAGAPGGFTVDESAAEAGYCTPRTCTSDGDCGADGVCSRDTCGP